MLAAGCLVSLLVLANFEIPVRPAQPPDAAAFAAPAVHPPDVADAPSSPVASTKRCATITGPVWPFRGRGWGGGIGLGGPGSLFLGTDTGLGVGRFALAAGGTSSARRLSVCADSVCGCS